MRLLKVLMLLMVISPAFSQDTLRVSARLNTFQSRIDSITSLAAISQVRDSLKINAWSDSLKDRINKRFSPQIVSGATDSLNKLKVPKPKIDLHTDSLIRKKDALLNEVNGQQEALQKRVSSRYKSWISNAKNKLNLDSAGVTLPSMPQADMTRKLPGVPGNSATAIPELPAMPGLNTGDFTALKLSPELAGTTGDIAIPSTEQLKRIDAAIPEIHNPLGEVTAAQSELKQLKSHPGAGAEKVAEQVEGVSGAKDQLEQAQQLTNEQKALADQLKDSKASAPEVAVDHFAGKEAVVQGAMKAVSKYKSKYSSVSSLSEMPKESWLPKNGLKGKPFRERFRPGLNLGVRSVNDTLLLDLYPNVAYRITGRIEAGLGGIYRLRVVSSPFGFDQQHPVWGISIFTVIKTFKSVFIRLETDGTSNVKRGAAEQQTYRDWRWSFHTGIQTNFKISKRVMGNVQALYNFDSSLKDGFPERLTARVGFQYSLKKK